MKVGDPLAKAAERLLPQPAGDLYFILPASRAQSESAINRLPSSCSTSGWSGTSVSCSGRPSSISGFPVLPMAGWRPALLPLRELPEYPRVVFAQHGFDCAAGGAVSGAPTRSPRSSMLQRDRTPARLRLSV